MADDAPAVAHRLEAPMVPAGHVLDGLVFVAVATAGWTPEGVRDFAAHLPRRLADCDIWLAPVPLIMTGRDPGPAGAVAGRLTILFVDRIDSAPDAPTVGGRVVDGVALIARHDRAGRLYAPEQTVAHELGHLLGLGHTDGRGIDLMSPRGCLFCRLSAAQCARLRAHPRVRPLS